MKLQSCPDGTILLSLPKTLAQRAEINFNEGSCYRLSTMLRRAGLWAETLSAISRLSRFCCYIERIKHEESSLLNSVSALASLSWEGSETIILE